MGCTPSPLAKQILAEATALAPRRNKASDGICGDAAHQARKSYHNSGDAADVTDDGFTFNSHAWADRIRLRCIAGKERRVDQIISNRRIATKQNNWAWRRYTGSNPHVKHVHYSLNTRSAGAKFFVAGSNAPAAKPKEWDEMATKKEVTAAAKTGAAQALNALTPEGYEGIVEWFEETDNRLQRIERALASQEDA